MTESPKDSARRGLSSSLAFNVLSLVFLFTVFSLFSFLFVPQLVSYDEPEFSIDEDSVPLSPYHPGFPLDPIDTVVYPEKEGEETNPPLEWKVGDIKRPKQRKAHPEDSDVDDLPFSKGMNPSREKKREFLYRLAKFIQPLHYDVNLVVSVKGRNGANESMVTGYASIHFRVNGEASNRLELHAEGFRRLDFVSLTNSAGEVVVNRGQEQEQEQEDKKPIRQHYNAVKRTVVWLLRNPLEDGEEYVMRVHWTTVAHSKGVLGLYETWEATRDGKRAYQLVTQGEVMGTRKWMPCFDEPALKATLSLTITHPSELNARSNAPIKSKIEVSDLRLTVFEKTALISPYLYAWSLTDYPELNTTVNGVTVSVIAARGLNKSLQHAKFAVESYFSALSINQSIEFKKIDFVFVPDHMSAMENVGHITSGVATINWRYMYVHEMMHQYFGNLITLSWWDEVWINEGLATMYEIDAVYGIGTEGAIYKLRKEREQHIRHDSLRKTIALKNEVTTEAEAWANFDKSYTKGSVVLYMMRNLIGEAAWKEGVQTFLNNFAFQAVKGDDFLRTIKEISEQYHTDQTPEFAYLMAKDFLELRGFPLLKIKRDGRKIELRQVRFVRGFFDDPSKENIALSRIFWRIPVHLTNLDGTPYKTILMSSRAMTVDVDTDEQLILDPKKIVYYRAVYDANTYKELAKTAPRKEDVEPILMDLIHSSLSGYVDPELAFDVIYRDFNLKSDVPMKEKVYALLSEMFHFDTERLARIFGLFISGSISANLPLPDLSAQNPSPDLCMDTHTFEDALNQYSSNRENLVLLFCPEVKKSMGEEAYGVLIGNCFFGYEQLLHPQDAASYIEILKMHYPNKTANWMVKTSRKLDDTFTEHDFTSLLHQVSNGFELGHTEQLRQIFENVPTAARENREFITRVFNEHHAAITEAKELGDKIESALKKHLTSNAKSAKSRVSFSGKPAKLPTLGLKRVPSRKLRYY